MASDLSSTQNEHDPIGSGDEPRLTLLRAVATARPMDEVASLVILLNQIDESPRPGDEALRLAAVSRPVEEVRQLVTLLKKPPHTGGDADTALCAAATERPIEEVAELVAIFGPDKGTPQKPEPVTAATTNDGPKAGSPSTALVTFTPHAKHAKETVSRGAAASKVAAVTAEGPTPSPARSALRRPAALVLLVIGIIHLPTGIAGLRSGDLAAGTSTAIAVLCLTLAVLLAVRDSVWAWAASAAVAVATVVAHSLAAGFNFADLLAESLGHAFTGATSLVVVCAAVAAALAGAALLRRPKPQAVVNDA